MLSEAVEKPFCRWSLSIYSVGQTLYRIGRCWLKLWLVVFLPLLRRVTVCRMGPPVFFARVLYAKVNALVLCAIYIFFLLDDLVCYQCKTIGFCSWIHPPNQKFTVNPDILMGARVVTDQHHFVFRNIHF